MLPPARLVCSVLAPMPLLVCAPLPELMVKSVGSINQVPARPLGAKVLTRVLSSTATCEAEVSMNPPSPPNSPPSARQLPSTVMRLSGLAKSAIAVMLPPRPALPGAALAVMLPVLLMAELARKRITPPLSTKPVASKLPVLRTTPLSKPLAAWADKMIKPPGACTALPLSTSADTVAGVTSTLFRLCLASKLSSMRSPAAITTAPILATTTPLLRTSGASKAM